MVSGCTSGLQTWLSTASARHIQCEINLPAEIK
ncbi:hypothetical protein T01_93 [Trichinella spiralis]|uniref:Uncharacterized protein n=1 Tax=Trichinella spiralis TaxID=6334 RepID=A0A0V1AJP2_TRISP|nr:hypothetical protein T01_10311 [Trichinella spiralis]KRY25325.1 hypothetical protein T01_93 [Trichinella spiralis]